MSTNARLTIAIQKNGRLNEDSISLLKRCGLKLLSSKSSLFYSAENLPIDLLLVRDDDIPTLVRDKVCDLGIIGENVLYEQENPNEGFTFDKLKALGFAKCRLSIAVPKESSYSDLTFLHDKKIATSYPQILQKFLQKNKIDARCVTISGSVEIAPRLKMSDAICDLVSTGRTLEENNLKEVQVILESQAVIIKATSTLSIEKNKTLDILLRRMEGVLQAQESKYILFHAPKNAINAIRKLLPGSESPTIIQLAECDDKVAVHVLSKEAVFWDTLEKLRTAGASSILVLPVEKMMF
jgi:ATP phosphoribosyltransferase